MYRVMFVDDEDHVCKTMEKLIPWDEYGVEVLPSAKSVPDAIQKINLYQPSIVFTDIEMPQTNGIELIRSMHKQTRFVVLSGYDDFKYVKTSMKLGALNYLLKPVSKDELIETLIECLNILDNEKQGRQSSVETIQALRDHTLCRLIRGQLSLNELREKSKVVDINLRHPKSVCVIFSALGLDIEEDALEGIKQTIAEKIFPEIPGYSFLDNSGNVVAILTFSSYTPDKAKVYGIIENCVSSIRQSLGIQKLFASAGIFVSTAMELNNSYSTAKDMLQYHLLQPERLVLHTNLKLNEKPINYYKPVNFALLTSLLADKNVSGLKSYIEDSLSAGYQVNTEIQQQRIIEIATHLMIAAEPLSLKDDDLQRIRRAFFQRIHDGSVYALYDLIQALISNLHNEDQQYSSKIRLAIQKMHDLYSDQNFSLKVLANEMNVNAAYLGRQFKSETGMFFSDYLNKVRIQKAQELLLVTDLSASEIGACVGYTTTNYFYGIFKKIVGVSTSAYRSYSKQQ